MKDLIHTRCFATIVCALLFSATGPVSTQADTLVVPRTDADREGAGLGLGFASGGSRRQTVYAASEFLEAMPQGGIITEIAFRVDGPLGGVVDGVVRDVEIRMSTTSMDPLLVLSQFYRFSNNVGPDETVVFPRGSLQLQSTWSPTGPNPFLLRIPLATPFTYDPRAGNLLMDSFIYEPFLGALPWDTTSKPLVRWIEGAIGQPRAVGDGAGPVTQFTFQPVPEPAAIILLLAGFGVALVVRRMRG